jgi:hypothetical protein
MMTAMMMMSMMNNQPQPAAAPVQPTIVCNRRGRCW